jgi:hypothetical protein
VNFPVNFKLRGEGNVNDQMCQSSATVNSRNATRCASRYDTPTMQLEDRVIRVGVGLQRLVCRLKQLDYQFTDPSAVLPGVESKTDAAIERIEREVGTLPQSLKLFWKKVGSVNLNGEHPHWSGCDYPDPLIVYPPSIAIEELDQFLGDQEERLRCNFPYLVPIAPDALHKANVSGGMWYNLPVPAVEDDPILCDEPHALSFTTYLEFALLWGGFAGLEDCPDHDWPLDELRLSLGDTNKRSPSSD